MKLKTILGWALCTAVLFAAFALVTGIALARTDGGVISGTASHYTLSSTMDQMSSTMLSGGSYYLNRVTLLDAQGNSRQEFDLSDDSGALFAADSQTSNETTNQQDATVLSGGHYRLTDTTLGDDQGDAWQESDIASGGGYHLKEPESPQLNENGCCCVYLPCVRR